MWGKQSISERWLQVLQAGLADPVTLLDSLEGGYILGVALACLLPVLRAGLDAFIYKVCRANPQACS